MSRRRHSSARRRRGYILARLHPTRRLVRPNAVGDDLAESCRQLALRLADLRARTAAYVRELRTRRAERTAWHQLLTEFRASPAMLVGSCVYCGRLRTSDGAWRSPPDVLRGFLRRHQRLSHTYCDDCLHAHGLD